MAQHLVPVRDLLAVELEDPWRRRCRVALKDVARPVSDQRQVTAPELGQPTFFVLQLEAAGRNHVEPQVPR